MTRFINRRPAPAGTPRISPEHVAIQTRNYWLACQWLAAPETSRESRQHAVAMLKALATTPGLGPLGPVAKQTLINNGVGVSAIPRRRDLSKTAGPGDAS